MLPILFGSSTRPLLGIYTPAAPTSRRRGVVICPPLGQEYIRSHRTCRVLADRLADAGHDVLRFDYYGTGDSGGEARELTLEGAVHDARAAAQEIRDVASVRRVTLVGLRAGALIAAHAARDVRAIDRLVLWDPVSDGADLVAGAVAEGLPLGDDGAREWQGFLFTRALQDELSDASLTHIADLPEEVLIVVSEASERHRDLTEHVRGTGADVELVIRESPPSWKEMAHLGVGALPVEALTHIAAWRT